MLHNISGWDDLPQHVRDEFENVFKNNIKASNLLQQAENAQRSGDYIIALNLYKKLDEIRLKAQYELMYNKIREVEKVSLLQMDLPREQIDRINILTIAMYIACDMIDFFALEVNEILRKKDDTARFEMFDPIRKIGKEARENLTYLWKNTSMFDTNAFHERSDDMREMLVNKSKKVYDNYNKNVREKMRGKATEPGKELV